jgi:hypothetical protein
MEVPNKDEKPIDVPWNPNKVLKLRLILPSLPPNQ